MTAPVDVDALRAEHVPNLHAWFADRSNPCSECDTPWPCLTIRALDAFAQRLADTTTALERIRDEGGPDAHLGHVLARVRNIATAALAAVAPAPPTEPVPAAKLDKVCPQSGNYIAVDTPLVGPDRATCPTCGRAVSFHRITGKFARHNRPVAAAPPTEPPKDFVHCFHDDMGEHGAWVWHHPNYHDKGRLVAAAPPDWTAKRPSTWTDAEREHVRGLVHGGVIPAPPTEPPSHAPGCAEVMSFGMPCVCRPVAPLAAAGPEETTNG